MIDTHDFSDGAGPVPAHEHANGGGWVAETATVAETAYVSGAARVSGAAQVSDNARVFGAARVFGNAQVFGAAQVSDNARVSGAAWVFGNAQVSDNARVSGAAQVSDNARVFGAARVFGNAQVSGSAQLASAADWLCLGPLGSRAAMLTVTLRPTLHVTTGCFAGDLAKFEARVAKVHGDDVHGLAYRAAIAFIRAWATLETGPEATEGVRP